MVFLAQRSPDIIDSGGAIYDPFWRRSGCSRFVYHHPDCPRSRWQQRLWTRLVHLSSLRGTTNGILFPVTTIGMTFGTSNCSAHKIVDNQGESVKFATLAYHDLVVQMAQGKGEHLAAFANTLGCPWQTQLEFNRTLQTSFQRIVPTDAVAPEAIVDQVRVELQTQPLLARACSGAVG